MNPFPSPAPDAPSDNVRNTDRLEAFSDGVIAIAITLLVLEVRVPHLDPGQGEADLLRALGDLWPAYVGYLTSFLTIGVLWANHHNIFRFFALTDQRLVVLNMLLLLCIGFIPFPTALLADYIGEPGERTATLVYGAWFTVTALFYNLVWRYATHDRRLIHPDTPQAALDAVNRRFQVGVPIYLVATLVAFFNPALSLVIFLALALFYILPSSSART